MNRRAALALAPLLLAGALSALLVVAAVLPDAVGWGPQPTLAAPRIRLLPTVHIAPARGWPLGGLPIAAAGLQVAAYASGLDHPRWLHTLPNGDVLVAETNAPPRPDNAPGFKGWVMGLVMQRAGAVTPSANRILLLRDADGDGVAELPAGPNNHHWTKNLIASADGRRLYITVGSNSNAGERGIEAEAGRAAIWELDLASGAMRRFASGLRNPNGLAWLPDSGVLWTVVNERDELGDDLVPDYLAAVQDGAFYGWPYSWFGAHVDLRPQPPRPDLVALARVPDYALGAHTASLGLAWSAGSTLPAAYAQGMFIGQHGSWNRRPHSGYQVVFVPFDGSRPAAGPPLPVLAGFLSADGQAYGRPVGVALDGQGAAGGRRRGQRGVARQRGGALTARRAVARSALCVRRRTDPGCAAGYNRSLGAAVPAPQPSITPTAEPVP